MAYLHSVFPRQFPGTSAAALRRPAAAPAPATRDPFLAAWHFVGLESELAREGDYCAIEAAGERGLVLRDPAGRLVGLANSCRHRPHALVDSGFGHLDGRLVCPVDGAVYDLAGQGHAGGLKRLDAASGGGLVFLRFLDDGTKLPALHPTSPGLAPLGAPYAIDAAASWQILLELLLDAQFPERPSFGPIVAEDGTGLAWQDAEGALRRRCLFPNLVIETRPDGVSVWEIETLAPGRVQLRVQEHATAGARLGPARRPGRDVLAELARLAESTERGLASRLYDAAGAGPDSRAVAAFKSWASRRG